MGYSKERDKDRMQENLINHGFEVPQMNILNKDHKKWNPPSGEVVPSLPVVDGRGGYNTHLFEVLSNILIPIALEITRVEVNSREETLSSFKKINRDIKINSRWR